MNNNEIAGNQNSVKEYEKCIICGKLTDISKDTPIRLRKNYVPGCGQLCDSCFEKMK